MIILWLAVPVIILMDSRVDSPHVKMSCMGEGSATPKNPVQDCTIFEI